MDVSDTPAPPPNLLAVRIGCRLIYKVAELAPTLLVVQPRRVAKQIVLAMDFSIENQASAERFTDSHGNYVLRTILAPGVTEICYDAILCVPDCPDEPAVESVFYLLKFCAIHCRADIANPINWERWRPGCLGTCLLD
jgi:hypothetical protein